MYLQMNSDEFVKVVDTLMTEYVNQFIKNVTNLGKKNIYIGLKLDVR